MSEICSGCNWFIVGATVYDLNQICLVTQYEEKESCPCQTCLVKTMCEVKCSARKAYFYKVRFNYMPRPEGQGVGGPIE
ncbi:MAG: hypothetical protein ACTSW1_07605 [Candidatus Hodarchaeales archaeon]